MAESEDGEIVFINRRHLVSLTVPLVEEAGDDVNAPLDGPEADGSTELCIVAHLTGGERIEGIVHYALPEAQRRIQDFLNCPHLFVALRRDGEVELVNTRCIVRVVPLDR